MKYSLVGFLLAALVACGSAVDPFDGGTADDQFDQVTLRTDRASYSATVIGGEGPYRTYGFTLVARFTNGLSRAIYLERCYSDTQYPIYGIGSGADGHSAAYNPTWACVGHNAPIIVLPGMTRTDSLRIVGPNAWDGRTNEPYGDLAGRFRLSYVAGTCRTVSGCELPGRMSESNEFEVRIQP